MANDTQPVETPPQPTEETAKDRQPTRVRKGRSKVANVLGFLLRNGLLVAVTSAVTSIVVVVLQHTYEKEQLSLEIKKIIVETTQVELQNDIARIDKQMKETDKRYAERLKELDESGRQQRITLNDLEQQQRSIDLKTRESRDRNADIIGNVGSGTSLAQVLVDVKPNADIATQLSIIQNAQRRPIGVLIESTVTNNGKYPFVLNLSVDYELSYGMQFSNDFYGDGKGTPYGLVMPGHTIPGAWRLMFVACLSA